MPWTIHAPVGLRPIGLLEQSDDSRLDKWTEMASVLLGAPAALLGILDGEREILRSIYGLGEPWASRRELPLSKSIARLAVAGNGALTIEDANRDARLSGNGILAELGAPACLAWPLCLPSGAELGALWVIDYKPRQWTESDKTTLQALGEAVGLEVALRVEQVARETVRTNLQNIMQHMLIHAAILSPDGVFMWVNETGLPAPSLRPEHLIGKHFLDAPWWHDSEESRALLSEKLEAAKRGENPRFDARTDTAQGEGRLDLTLVPILDGDGQTNRILVTGVDVTARAAIEERQKLLTQEMAHRIRNLMSVIMSVSSQSLGMARSLDEASNALRERLMAMSRCHSALLANQWNGVRLEQLICDELAAYEGRFDTEGPPVTIDGASAQTMALILHELATNAAKHGALSNAAGRIRIRWERIAGDRIRLRWDESGGPQIRPPERTGFGHSILVLVAEQEFSASPEISYAAEGLRYAVDFPG